MAIKILRRALTMVLALGAISIAAAADRPIPAGAKVFIAPMSGGYETYIKAAIQKKKVPVVIVETREAADFELSGASESQKASTAKKILALNWHSTEQASIKVTDLKSSEVVFAYSVHKASSAHGKQSSAEACAKHLKDAIRK